MGKGEAMDSEVAGNVTQIMACWRFHFLALNWQRYKAAYSGTKGRDWWKVDVLRPLAAQEESVARQGCAEMLWRESNRLQDLAKRKAPSKKQKVWWKSVQRCALCQATLAAWQAWFSSSESELPAATVD